MSRRKTYYLVDTSRSKDQIRLMRMCEVACNIAMYHNGSNLARTLEKSDEFIRKYWIWDNYPPNSYILRHAISIPNIKWFIRHHFKDTNSSAFNSDFLFGLTKCGKVRYPSKRLPSFNWRNNFNIIDILDTSPYSGTFSINCKRRNVNKDFEWRYAAAFLLPHDENSGSFVAGVMATGEVKNIENSTVVAYDKSIEEHFVKWGIPIELRSNNYIMISPVWSALFSIYMPEICNKKFLNLKHPLMSEVYCPILWRAYVSLNFVSGGIPYLKSRRMILYDHKCEDGALEKLDRLRVEKNLTILDNVVINCVKKWGQNVCNNSQAS